MLRRRLQSFLESNLFQNSIMIIIVLNGITLGLETVPSVVAAVGPVLKVLDTLFLSIFVSEIAAGLVAYGWRFFSDPWKVFDFIIVGIALVPATGPFSVLRSLRILRVLRLISTAPQLRKVVTALLGAIPGMGAIVGILLLLFYVAAVMATKLFGGAFPVWFGTIGESMYTLFQIMTLESWSMGIARPVMEKFPFAWIFFAPFIMIATFTMLNLFIAVIVNAMQSASSDQVEKQNEQMTEIVETEHILESDVMALRKDIEELKAMVKKLVPRDS